MARDSLAGSLGGMVAGGAAAVFYRRRAQVQAEEQGKALAEAERALHEAEEALRKERRARTRHTAQEVEAHLARQHLEHTQALTAEQLRTSDARHFAAATQSRVQEQEASIARLERELQQHVAREAQVEAPSAAHHAGVQNHLARSTQAGGPCKAECQENVRQLAEARAQEGAARDTAWAARRTALRLRWELVRLSDEYEGVAERSRAFESLVMKLTAECVDVRWEAAQAVQEASRAVRERDKAVEERAAGILVCMATSAGCKAVCRENVRQLAEARAQEGAARDTAWAARRTVLRLRWELLRLSGEHEVLEERSRALESRVMKLAAEGVDVRREAAQAVREASRAMLEVEEDRAVGILERMALEAELQSKDAALAVTTTELESTRERCAKSEREHAEALQRMHEAQTARDDLVSQLVQLTRERDNNCHRVDTLTQQLHAQRTIKPAGNLHTSEPKRRIAGLTKQLQQRDAALAKLTHTVSELERYAQRCDVAAADHSRELGLRGDREVQDEGRVAELEASLAERDAEISTMAAREREWQDTIACNTKQIQTLQANGKKLGKGYMLRTQQGEELGELRRAVDDHAATVARLTESNAALEVACADGSLQQRALSESKEALEAVCAEQRATIARLQADGAALEAMERLPALAAAQSVRIEQLEGDAQQREGVISQMDAAARAAAVLHESREKDLKELLKGLCRELDALKAQQVAPVCTVQQAQTPKGWDPLARPALGELHPQDHWLVGFTAAAVPHIPLQKACPPRDYPPSEDGNPIPVQKGCPPTDCFSCEADDLPTAWEIEAWNFGWGGAAGGLGPGRDGGTPARGVPAGKALDKPVLVMGDVSAQTLASSTASNSPSSERGMTEVDQHVLPEAASPAAVALGAVPQQRAHTSCVPATRQRPLEQPAAQMTTAGASDSVDQGQQANLDTLQGSAGCRRQRRRGRRG